MKEKAPQPQAKKAVPNKPIVIRGRTTNTTTTAAIVEKLTTKTEGKPEVVSTATAPIKTTVGAATVEVETKVEKIEPAPVPVVTRTRRSSVTANVIHSVDSSNIHLSGSFDCEEMMDRIWQRDSSEDKNSYEKDVASATTSVAIITNDVVATSPLPLLKPSQSEEDHLSDAVADEEKKEILKINSKSSNDDGGHTDSETIDSNKTQKTRALNSHPFVVDIVDDTMEEEDEDAKTEKIASTALAVEDLPSPKTDIDSTSASIVTATVIKEVKVEKEKEPVMTNYQALTNNTDTTTENDRDLLLSEMKGATSAARALFGAVDDDSPDQRGVLLMEPTSDHDNVSIDKIMKDAERDVHMDISETKQQQEQLLQTVNEEDGQQLQEQSVEETPQPLQTSTGAIVSGIRGSISDLIAAKLAARHVSVHEGHPNPNGPTSPGPLVGSILMKTGKTTPTRSGIATTPTRSGIATTPTRSGIAASTTPTRSSIAVSKIEANGITSTTSTTSSSSPNTSGSPQRRKTFSELLKERELSKESQALNQKGAIIQASPRSSVLNVASPASSNNPNPSSTSATSPQLNSGMTKSVQSVTSAAARMKMQIMGKKRLSTIATTTTNTNTKTGEGIDVGKDASKINWDHGTLVGKSPPPPNMSIFKASSINSKTNININKQINK